MTKNNKEKNMSSEEVFDFGEMLSVAQQFSKAFKAAKDIERLVEYLGAAHGKVSGLKSQESLLLKNIEKLTSINGDLSKSKEDTESLNKELTVVTKKKQKELDNILVTIDNGCADHKKIIDAELETYQNDCAKAKGAIQKSLEDAIATKDIEIARKQKQLDSLENKLKSMKSSLEHIS